MYCDARHTSRASNSKLLLKIFIARSEIESGELSKDGHRPSMHVLILLVHREHRRNSEREILNRIAC